MSEYSQQEVFEQTQKIFDSYERRFSRARADQPLRRPWEAQDRQKIAQHVREILKIESVQIPEIKVLQEEKAMHDGIEVRHMLFESWKHFYGVASLLVPKTTGKAPLIVICPGHGAEGRLSESYQRMAMTLVRQGTYVLLLENIGQGCRSAFGHWLVPEVFYCGYTLQGLIVQETRAWIRYMSRRPYVDASRIGACGNSGGGTLTEFLAATEPALAALASSGYPSEFDFILRKEKKHCDCNLLCHVLGKLEMWEVYSLFAPKPLLLECGENDSLIPVDLFHKNARKVRTVYEMMQAESNFHAEVAPTLHSWATEDIAIISDFFEKNFALEAGQVYQGTLMEPTQVHLTFPEDAISTGKMAEELSGITMPEGLTLPDIVKPQYQGKNVEREMLISHFERGDLMRVFSQFEFVLQ